MRNVYGSLSPEPTALELENRALSRRAAAEGFVLLKNENNALPLVSKKLALYGAGARRTVKGGLGSGSLDNRYNVNIEDGLKNAGYEITSGKWLDDYDQAYETAYREWHDYVEAQIRDLTDPHDIIVTAHSYVFRCPDARVVTEADVRGDAADTAVYVITRQAGEGNDRKLEAGDYYLTDIEKESLSLLVRSYEHVVVIVNVGGLVEFSFMDEIPGIDALVLYIQGGEEGGNALADVLSGKVNFSGKTAVTIPLKYEDIPFGDRFSSLGPDPYNSDYTEGIYVGYRYYDSFGVPVRYPFGFGLSYTSFVQEAAGLRIAGGSVYADVKVSNVGDAGGREVVQAYVSLPDGPRDHEYQRLIAFAKTGEIAPGASDVAALSFDLADLAGYDEAAAAWKLEAGDYILRIGNSSRNTVPAAVLRLPETVTVLQCRNCQAPAEDLPAFAPAGGTAEEVPAGVPVLDIAPALVPACIVNYTQPQVKESEKVSEILDSMTVEEQLQLLRGGALQDLPRGAFDIPGAAGKTSTALLDKGIPDVIFADGPAGISVAAKVFAMPDGTYKTAEVAERYNWGIVGRTMKEEIARTDAPVIYRYATAWPVSMLQAQTWDTALLEEIGDAVGKEMEAFGITVWLAPGMNIQKNTLGGRTFEYYSEDPVVSGKMAAALTKGVQSHPGCGVSIKHFCCNNIEDNRLYISANVSERALREIYLKGFEIAVKESAPMTVMSSYNLVNHVYTANSPDLLTDILRCEWGYDGMVMSDWGSCDEEKNGDPAKCAPAGNDIIMPGCEKNVDIMRSALQDKSLSPETVRRSAARVLRVILEANTYAE